MALDHRPLSFTDRFPGMERFAGIMGFQSMPAKDIFASSSLLPSACAVREEIPNLAKVLCTSFVLNSSRISENALRGFQQLVCKYCDRGTEIDSGCALTKDI